MSQTSEIINMARSFAASPGWSKTKLARASGLSPNALRDLEEDGFNPTSFTLEKLEACMSKNNFTSRSNHQ